VLIAALLGILFALGSIWAWWRLPDSRRDGLELIGLVAAILYTVFLVLPTLVLGILGRWLPLAAILGAIALALASDTVLPWIPWPDRAAVSHLLP
jgi:hypothetical protein